jgi:hypothetical protein
MSADGTGQGLISQPLLVLYRRSALKQTTQVIYEKHRAIGDG